MVSQPWPLSRLVCRTLHPDSAGTEGGTNDVETDVQATTLLLGRHSSLERVETNCARCGTVVASLVEPHPQNDTTTDYNRILVLKVCDVPALLERAPRDFHKLQTDVNSYLNETKFYESMYTLLPRQLLLACYGTHTKYDAADISSSIFSIALEWAGPTSHYHCPSLDSQHIKAALRSYAMLHASASRHAEATASWPVYGTFWFPRPEKRPSSELASIVSTWDSFVMAFSDHSTLSQHLKSLLWVGHALFLAAPDIEDRQQELTRQHPCLVHGDSKSWNLFFCKSNPGNAKLIDFQWFGRGFAAMDTEYLFATSFQHETSDPEVAKESWRAFRTFYYQELTRANAEVGNGRGLSCGVEEFCDMSDMCFLGYAVVLVSRIWRGLTPQRLEENAASKKPGMSTVNSSSRQIMVVTTLIASALTKHFANPVGEAKQTLSAQEGRHSP